MFLNSSGYHGWKILCKPNIVILCFLFLRYEWTMFQKETMPTYFGDQAIDYKLLLSEIQFLGKYNVLTFIDVYLNVVNRQWLIFLIPEASLQTGIRDWVTNAAECSHRARYNTCTSNETFHVWAQFFPLLVDNLFNFPYMAASLATTMHQALQWKLLSFEIKSSYANIYWSKLNW